MRNDLKRLKGEYRDGTSKRSANVVLVSRSAALAAYEVTDDEESWSRFLDPPSKTLPWCHVKTAVEFKRHNATLLPPSTSYAMDGPYEYKLPFLGSHLQALRTHRAQLAHQPPPGMVLTRMFSVLLTEIKVQRNVYQFLRLALLMWLTIWNA